jgi:hypothetical protein
MGRRVGEEVLLGDWRLWPGSWALQAWDLRLSEEKRLESQREHWLNGWVLATVDEQAGQH